MPIFKRSAMTQQSEHQVCAPALRDAPKLVSVVVPLYNESGNVKVVARAIREALGSLKYELVLVDDGSTDSTSLEIEQLSAEDCGVVGVCLARNFGHQSALAAGLSVATGSVIVMMDGDMQHPPSLLPELVAKWREGYNVVQTRRLDAGRTPLLKRLASRWFYKVFRRICRIEVDPGMADFRLIDRSVLDQLNKLEEGDMFFRGMLAWMGFRQAVVPFEVGQRRQGKSKYTLRKMIGLAKTGLFSFSSLPLRISTRLGLLMALAAAVEFVYVIVVYLRGTVVAGWASTTAVMSALFSMLFLLMGIQGEYIHRIYERVRRRPAYLVGRIIRRGADAPSEQ